MVRLCPRCGVKYSAVPVSAKDKTLICPDCGAREAMDIFNLKEEQKDEIISIMHRERKHEKSGAGKNI